MSAEFAAEVAEVARRWRLLTPRAWSEPAPGDPARTRADLAYELCAGWAGGRPLPRPAYPAALADMLVVLAAELLREGGDATAARERLRAYAGTIR